jgi:hypothetical protein
VPPSWNPNKYGPSHGKNSFREKDTNLESGFFDKSALNELTSALVEWGYGNAAVGRQQRKREDNVMIPSNVQAVW